MNDRWIMNRLGFVNFWLYDVEDIPFENGKLLLRGQNGSGKSITTQSFIPFILDGDKTPSRLDPFGSSDRKMEYYFLGDGEKEESTGYLYLEFRKENKKEYRTIGIGQRARRGKPMEFWGFIVIDGRRIGHNLHLYDESGSTRIPLGKNDWKRRLGESNVFTDSPGEYKKLVNKYLFGFSRMEQYDQFVRLLVKVRAPKLSKEFKPTKVYDILNDSLQTLTDEDLRPMVDAMEKMDSIQASLEQLERALGDAKAIRNEYSRYNQFMLGKKAKAYLDAKGEASRAQASYEKQKLDMDEYKKQQKAKQQQKEAVIEQIQLIQTERNTLLESSNLEEMDAKLQASRKDLKEQEEKKKKYQERNENNEAELRKKDREKRQLEDENESLADEIEENLEEFSFYQETVQWSGHSNAEQTIKEQNMKKTSGIQNEIILYQKNVQKGKESVERYEQDKKQLDESTEKAETAKCDFEEKNAAAEYAEKELEMIREATISELYKGNSENEVWILNGEELALAEKILQEYVAGEGRKLDKIFWDSYLAIRGTLETTWTKQRNEWNTAQNQWNELNRQYQEVLAQQEMQPARTDYVEASRKRLEELGIAAIPFYKTVEFDEELSEEECALLESQLTDMGLLDALVISEENFERIQKEFPEMTDCVIRPLSQGTGNFRNLKVSDALDAKMQVVVSNILSHFSQSEDGKELALWMSLDGSYGQGILYGKAAPKESAEFVGVMARKRRKERILSQLQVEMQSVSNVLKQLEGELTATENCKKLLEYEYKNAVTTAKLDDQFVVLQKKQMECSMAEKNYHGLILAKEKNEWICSQSYQTMLTACKFLPYGRTVSAYGEALADLEEYKNIWSALVQLLKDVERNHSQIRAVQDSIEYLEDVMDDLYREMQYAERKIKEFQMQVKHCEEILNDPEVRQKAQRLQNLKKELDTLGTEKETLSGDLRVLEQEIIRLENNEDAIRSDLITKVEKENLLRQYFEEEMLLELVFERETRTLEKCARDAVLQMRKVDENRDASTLVASLHKVFTEHSGNLIGYSTALEECFEEAEAGSGALRKRYRISSAWNGKKVYLEAFYNILKSAISETELLIQQKDRELFEDILSKTISQQLTDRIAESRKWVQDMSALMKLDTSMGLYFALDWKPRSAENEQELDVADLEKILLRDRELLTDDDMEKVAAHFRSKIRTEKRMVEEEGLPVNYMDLVRDALDYRKWFAFQMFYYRGADNRKPLTNAAFNKFSGGEKAMAMYAPLFAAVNAQYKKATNADHPRIIALDEAFAGVDDKNISSMFQLVASMDFDYIMNSQALWGCYASVPALHIAELRRPLNSQTVSVIHYTWNGHERILDEQ